MALNTPILIIGGGIGGLTLALAAVRHGLPAPVILEARPEPSTDGAGIQIGPNAARVLAQLGLVNAFRQAACWPDAIVVRKGETGRELQRLPLGDRVAQRFGAPYLVVHRADLHAVLTDAAAAAGVPIRYGMRIDDVHQTNGAVVVTAASGEAFEGAVVVGADGLWSRMRKFIAPFGHRALEYAGKSAARTLLPVDQAPDVMRQNAIGTWLSSHGHVVHYPIRGGHEIAVVIVVQGPEPKVGWGNRVDVGGIDDAFFRIAPALDHRWVPSQQWRCWALYDPEPLRQWSKGRLTLLGDAAHPVLPFLAQGGAMAIEDAWVLASHLAGPNGGTPSEALAAYEAERIPRTAQVQAASRRNGHVFHMSWPGTAVRDATMKAVGGARLIDRYNWLYGWTPVNSAKTPVSGSPAP